MKPEQLPVKHHLDLPINNIFKTTNIWPDEIPFFVGSHNYVHTTYYKCGDGENLCAPCAEPYENKEICKFSKGLYHHEWVYILREEFWCTRCTRGLFEWLSEIEDMVLIKPELVPAKDKEKWVDDIYITCLTHEMRERMQRENL